MESVLELVGGVKVKPAESAYEPVPVKELDSLALESGKNVDERVEFEGPTEDLFPGENETKTYCLIAIPAIFANLFFYLLFVLTASYAGTHLGAEALGGFSLANLSGNILGKSLIFGMLSAFDTLAPRAFGSKAYNEVGYLIQRSFFILIILCFIVAIIWWYMEPLLILLGQPPSIVTLAARFLKITIMILPSDLVAELAKRFLGIQNIVYPFVIIQGITACLHYFYLSLFVGRWGFDGLGFAHVASSYSCMSLSLFYLYMFQPHCAGTWVAIDCSEACSVEKVKEYLRLGIPGILSMGEWWYWEVICFIAGNLGAVTLEAHSIGYNLVPLAFMVPMGIQTAATTRIGNLLANGRVKLAQKVALSSVLAGLVAGNVYAALTYVYRDSIIKLYTDDVDALMECQKFWSILCVFLIIDNLQGITCGILRGLGKQFILSVILNFCMWILGVPLAYFAVFVKGEGIRGLWIFMVLPYIVVVAGTCTTAWLTDWHALSQSIQASHKQTKTGAKQEPA